MAKQMHATFAHSKWNDLYFWTTYHTYITTQFSFSNNKGIFPCSCKHPFLLFENPIEFLR